MNEIKLINLKLKTFTEQDVLNYCLLNNINPGNIIELYLFNNELTDISGIKLFKNLRQLNIGYNKITDISVLKDLINLTELYMYNNQIKDISVLKNLTKLNILNIGFNKIKDISVLSNLIKLKKLYLNNNKIKDISVIKDLKDLEILNIDNLELESDQIQYINSINNLQELWCENGFKDMKVLKQLNNSNNSIRI